MTSSTRISIPTFYTLEKVFRTRKFTNVDRMMSGNENNERERYAARVVSKKANDCRIIDENSLKMKENGVC